jgi:hypothetical protein
MNAAVHAVVHSIPYPSNIRIYSSNVNEYRTYTKLQASVSYFESLIPFVL